LVVLESTYGNRLHEGRKERKDKLQEVIERALQDRGVILIPAFSIGRTQELLYEIEELIHRNQQRFVARNLPWEELEVILDSPLASKFTNLYLALQPFWDAEAKQKLLRGRRPLAFEQMTTIDHHQNHLHTVDYLRRKARPCIVIAASGMCAGGRIVNYLKALIGDPRTDILFSGYQAVGTPGRAIQEYGPHGGHVFLDGQRCEIKARIHTISGYSAHADQKDLVNFIKRMRKRPQHVRLVHGEPEAQQTLRTELEKHNITVG
jgi:metallo-beta-lactamase family protein